MVALSIRGIVFSGKGEGTRFTQLPWVESQIRDKLGFTPHPGTLNIKIAKDDLKNRNTLEKTKGIPVSPVAGFDRGCLFRAILKSGLKCAVVIPRSPGYRKDVIEIIA
ncbi:MAG: DUF120 domain-containing protein, partial [Candidatus Korarchaeota archaeon]|nr:DUF120 domain-containing protein [Candidatus Korarchaeota archaeon]NIU84258.1 DUF120 domain-containing protein [Candidatus Thorarchaeota archaeon]